MSYQNSLKEKRKAVNGPSASDVGSQRLGSKGYSSKGRSRFIDENDADKLKASLVPRRSEESSVIQSDSITKLFNKVFASNQTVKEQLRQYEDGSTRAMTVDGKPVDMLNKGYDVSKDDTSADSFLEALITSESSGSSTAVNEKVDKKGKRKFVGFLQFGKDRLLDYMKETGAEFTQDDFMDDTKLQKVVADWHIKDIDKEIASLGNLPDGFNNKNGLRAVAHLGGISGMKRFIKTRGKYNPDDASVGATQEGTKLSDYYKKFSNI